MRMRADDNLIEWPVGDTAARVLGASQRRRGPFQSLLLRSLVVPYRSGVWLHNAAFDLGLRRARQASVPVISVGNIVAGGAGKTPFTRWLVAELTARGRTVAILHGGYGSDEPELHRKWHPAAIVVEQKNRVRAAAYAASRGADIVVLDDAFQHRRLARDLDIVLTPVETDSSRLLPRGPLREPESALGRADLIVVTRKTASAEATYRLAARLRKEYRKPYAIAAILPVGFRHGPDYSTSPTGTTLVVAAIARPDLLLRQLREQGIQVDKMLAYPDHYVYTNGDRDRIRRAAAGKSIVTTEKDAIKLQAYFEPSELWILEQRVTMEAGRDTVVAMIERVL